VRQVAGKEVYSVQTVFPSVLMALYLLSQFSVGLHSVVHFCLVSFQADCDSRQHMFQFAVSEVLCILVVCTAVIMLHSQHLKIMKMVLSSSQTCFASNKRVAQCMLKVLLTTVFQTAFSVRVLTMHLSSNIPLGKNCKNSGLANKAKSPASYTVARKYTKQLVVVYTTTFLQRRHVLSQLDRCSKLVSESVIYLHEFRV
jgi:hypothetical protein